MKRLWMPALAGLVGCVLLAGAPTFGGDGDSKKSESRTAKKPVSPDAAKTAAATTESKPRLPNGWGRLGLSKDQHDQIVSVMQKYQPQLKQLEAQIVELKQKQLVDMRGLLNETQKHQLAALDKSGAASSGNGSTGNADGQPVPRKRRRRQQ